MPRATTERSRLILPVELPRLRAGAVFLYCERMDGLGHKLAVEARLRKLDAVNQADCPEELVRAFAQVVLEELAARGLLAGPAEVGCWAQPRPEGN